MHVHLLAFGGVDLVRYVRHGGYDIHVELAVETLLHYLHVEQPQKAASETESQRQRRFGLEREGGIVQTQLLQRCPQIFVLVGVGGVDSGEDHGLHILESLYGLETRGGGVGYGVAHLYVYRVLDTRYYIADVSGANLSARGHLQLQNPYLVGVVLAPGVEEFDVIAGFDSAVHDTEIGYYAPERIEY